MIRPSYLDIVNDKLEEHVLGISRDFPYTSLYVDLDQYVGGYAPWHWHNELEFFYVIKGGIRYILEDGEYEFNAGEGGFVNANVLHMTKTIQNGGGDVFSAQLMAPRFISGSYDSLLANKYMAPILRCEAIKIKQFRSGQGLEGRILKCLEQAHDLEIDGPAGYEFKIRELMSRVWMDLYDLTSSLWQVDQTKKNPDTKRIKDMLSFISHHYAEKISLEQIACAANISERESFRCFQRCLRMTPFEYLMTYRLQEASALLIGTDLPIGRIGEQCGFSSNSYFGKTFKEKMGCTPKVFRNRHKDLK